MDSLPSKSLSKSILIAAPLFILVLAILHASNEISYLFILKYVNNMAGKADMTFVPTMQPQNNNPNYNEIFIKRQNGILNFDFANQMNFNLVNLESLRKWTEQQPLVRGFSPRWLIPSETDGTDSLLLFIDVKKEKQIGLTDQSKFYKISQKNVALSAQLAMVLNKKVGDTIKTSFKLSNLLNGARLLQKYRGQGSGIQQQSTFQTDFNEDKIIENLANQFNITKQQAKKILGLFMEAEVPLNYKVKEIFTPDGLYPSILHNVIVIDYSQIKGLMADFVVAEINAGTFDSFIPQQYKPFWMILKSTPNLAKRIQDGFKQYTDNFALMAATTLNKRIDLYHPDEPIKAQFSQTLQSAPNNMDVISLYPLYELSLKLKFFFQSILQIFEFVSCLIFFYTMSLIMKQLYEEKQIEVGLWRTLGAGGIRIINRQANKQNQANIQKATWRDQLFFGWFLIRKVGFFYYWLISVSLSMLLYIGYKYIFFLLVCDILNEQQINQSLLMPIVVFLGVFLFVQGLAASHIQRILTNPLVQTIKPVKRTYDLVKVRMLNLSTFGISPDTMLVAIMLTYYGITAYYFIPYNILMDNEETQIYLFNSIFLFMILGAVMLVSVLQSKIEILILRGFFLMSSRFRKMKVIMIKNIRAKQYKNIKVCVIVALTFAFLLFFSSGVKIQIKIIQSFIQRSLGSDIVLENFEQKTFNKSKVDKLLDAKNISHAWLSKDINRANIKFKFINHMAPKMDIRFQIKVLTPEFLNCSYYKYYVPYDYADGIQYSKLPNGQYNGFDAIYYPNNGSSRGQYNSQESIHSIDPYDVNVKLYDFTGDSLVMPNQQIINVALSRFAQQLIGVKAGSIYKLKVSNSLSRKSFFTRARIMHSLKASPAFDILGLDAFISQEQIKYILKNLQADIDYYLRYQRLLFLKPESSPQRIKGVGESIVRISAQHTQLFDIDNVRYTFQLLVSYLDGFVIIITTIMAALNIFFIAVYTIGKCRDEAEMFKMLRAIGLHISDIRWMIFLQILIRLIVAILNGIILGIILSQGFALQIQVPSLDLTNIILIAVVLLFVFAISVNFSTRYLTKRNVLNTTKL